MSEHPFAAYVRILGKGPRLSRPLTLDETRAAVTMILRDEVEPVQLGAFLCLMRARTETPEEVAGFALAIQDSLAAPTDLPPAALDWPSYGGKSRRPPLFILSALLLAEAGVAVAMHGSDGEDSDHLRTGPALASLGIAAAGSLAEAGRQLAADNFTYVPLDRINPRLAAIMALRPLLGLRSPLNTAVRHLNPFGAPASLVSVFHPHYRAVHVAAAKLAGTPAFACFKGEGGEAERRPEKPCRIEGIMEGGEFAEEWQAVTTASSDDTGLPLAALWRGDVDDPVAEATVTATAAIALRLLGRAACPADAEALAGELWRGRRRDRFR